MLTPHTLQSLMPFGVEAQPDLYVPKVPYAGLMPYWAAVMLKGQGLNLAGWLDASR